ncbi:MAG: zf-HC2 domain-containing protein [Planctomycetota bacterium]|jgi:outer membrane lipoprotein-sorting protein
MDKHKDMDKLLVSFALGELSSQAQAELKKHMDECHRCRGEFARIKALLEGAGHIRELSVDSRICESVEQAILDVVKNQQTERQTSGPNISLEFIRRITMKKNKAKLVAAAAVVMIVLSGVREQAVFVGRYGHTHVSGNWSRIYQTDDRSRRDKFYESTDESTFGDNSPDSVLVKVTWDIPDGNDLMSYNVSFEHQCYTIKVREDGAYQRDPMQKLRSFVGLLDKADRILETEIFDGRECVGFEISTGMCEDGSKEVIDRIWLDVETMLPVRMEKHGLPVTNNPGRTFTFIDDQFEYHAQVPADIFEPEIPEDFIEAEPDDIRAAKEAQEKGQMNYAEVPAGLRDEVVAALKSVKTAVFRERHQFGDIAHSSSAGGPRVSLSEHDWRRDFYSGENLRKAEWFVVDQGDWGKTSHDFNDKGFQLTQTTVNFADGTYKIVTHSSESHPDNPMDRIVFLASHLDRADRFMEDEQIEGIDCFGFELSAKKYGTNPDDMLHRLWFDAATNLPVRMELEWLEDDGLRKNIRDKFQWNPPLAAETFTPEIPSDFTLEEPN